MSSPFYKPDPEAEAKLAAAAKETEDSKTAEIAAVASAPTLADSAPALTQHYTCLPIERYQIGGFEFTKGYLSLSDADSAVFEDLIHSQPIQEQARIRKLAGPPQLANAGVSMVRGIDHTGNTTAAPSAVQQG